MPSLCRRVDKRPWNRESAGSVFLLRFSLAILISLSAAKRDKPIIQQTPVFLCAWRGSRAVDSDHMLNHSRL